ncbi:MAG: DUF169 domain-containing protein [Candidatus Lokiarchaeota archaeon]|nr:DUF169 domain-containing protein [Candidatus Lokiarchaeota archaeon]
MLALNKFEKFKQALYLKSNVIGVKLIYDHDSNIILNSNFKQASKSESYCEYVKRASEGEFLIINKGDLSCHIAEVMLGFEDSDNLELSMKLDIKGLKSILLFPVYKMNQQDYDSIIIIVNPRNCMNIIQAYVRLFQKPLKITCGAINGVCSEVTAYVIKRNDVNFSFLCPNSRVNGMYGDYELLCGIPAKMVNELIDEIIEITQYNR